MNCPPRPPNAPSPPARPRRPARPPTAVALFSGGGLAISLVAASSPAVAARMAQAAGAAIFVVGSILLGAAIAMLADAALR